MPAAAQGAELCGKICFILVDLHVRWLKPTATDRIGFVGEKMYFNEIISFAVSL